MRKIWDFHGGIHPRENKTQSTGEKIGHIPLPDELTIPVNQHIGTPAKPVVTVGEKVLKGQLIAEAEGVFSTCAHASTSGTVIAIEDRVVPHPSGMSALCIVIAPDGEEKWTALQPCENYLEQPRHALVEKLRRAGLAGMGGAGFPTSVKLSPKSIDKVDTLIINAAECEPYITADDALMREKADEIILGIKLFDYILGSAPNILIGIENNKPEAIEALKNASESTNIDVVVIPTKYPSGGEKQLIQILTGREVPSQGLPSHVGVLVQNIGTALAAYRAVRFGEPLISRITTIVGQALAHQRNVEVLIGTPIQHVLAQHGFKPELCSRLVIGGPMMGYTVERTDIPVIKTTNCILASAKNELPDLVPAQACIRCGMCAEVCPANLLPQQLYWYSRAEDHDKLQSYNLFDCIECGACSYVCPSNLPLVQYYRASKGSIRHAEAEKKKSDHARQRFELRKQRIERAEAEKEAKRAERKKAAEQAKLKLAEQSAKSSSEPSAAEQKPALDKNVLVQQDPNVQKAKLERALSSAQSRVERARAQLDTAREENDPTRVDALAARLKEAELKLAEANSKLAAFGTQDAGDIAASKSAPLADPQQAVDTLKKRLATAEQKLAEAEQAGSPTTEALRNGVEKLRAKLLAAEEKEPQT